MYVKTICLLLFSAMIPVSADHVTGVLGGHVVLPCTMSKDLLEAGRRSSYPSSFVLWQRRDRIPQTVHKLLPSGVTYTSRRARDRVLVPPSLTNQGIFSLHLNGLMEQDAGMYRAVARYGGSKQKCLATLRTIKLIQFPLGPLPENSSFNLTCRIVDPDSSSTSVRWIYNGILVQPSSRISVSGSRLYIHRLTLEDHGKWSCEVDGARSSVTLLVVGVSGLDPLSVYTAIGSSVELPCNITHLPVERRLPFHWSKDKKSINDNNQVVVLNHVRPEDAGTYQCDTTYKGQRLTRLMELRVIQVSPSGPVFTKEGSQLWLQCNISISTGKERFQWIGPSLPDGQRKVIQGTVVDLPDVHTEDSGAWTCSVYGMNGILGELEHWVYVHAAQTAGVGSFTSWHVLLLLMIILVFCLAVIAFISFRNHKRRLSHLTALTSIGASSTSQPKKPSVSE
ncbi:lymphocyte activation gene 3 protein [Bufo bufo]|uniref:lymphocyte activation gene 3 protein n=1 Tax=Bufo bufo TaxID=8384 RepID=UPI001ABE51F4|nr:lymphocyte activation gene 3 protein [Bufo bufo]